MPSLRGHHLICLHFFNGEGCDQTFINNLQEVLKNVHSEGVKIGYGGDDVCGKCPYLDNNACRSSENADTDIREMDRKALELLNRVPGETATWDSIKTRIPSIFADWFSTYCTECDWRTACEKDDFFSRIRPLNS